MFFACFSTAHNQIELISGSGAVALRFRYVEFLVVISPCLAIFKNFVHSSEPGETPSISASYQAPKYAQHPYISQNISKRFGVVANRLRLFFQFT